MSIDAQQLLIEFNEGMVAILRRADGANVLVHFDSGLHDIVMRLDESVAHVVAESPVH